MQIGLFGSIGDQLGRDLAIDAPGAGSIGDLRRLLAELHPAAADLFQGPSLKACVADRLVDDDFSIDGIERVEFFPPLSGG
jgi:sulfur-carrier protein